MKIWLRRAFFAFAVLFCAGTFLNASWVAPTPVGKVGLIAHRAADPGIGSCVTAPGAGRYPVLPDNSLAAVGDARQLGASMIAVEIAADGSVAPAKCANSYGSKPTPAQLVRAASPKSLLFTFTGDDPAAADRLVAGLKAAGRDPVAARDGFYASRQAGPVARMRQLLPAAWSFSAESATACADAYRRVGWFGIIPAECKRGTMMIALDRQGSLAGWPNRLLARMAAANSRVIVVAPGAVNGDPRGLTFPEQFGEIPDSFNGLIWTDDLWNLGPALFPRVDNRSRLEQEAGEAAVKARRAQ